MIFKTHTYKRFCNVASIYYRVLSFPYLLLKPVVMMKEILDHILFINKVLTSSN